MFQRQTMHIATLFSILYGFTFAQPRVVSVGSFQDYVEGCFTDNNPIRRVDYSFRGTSTKVVGDLAAFSFADAGINWFVGSVTAKNGPDTLTTRTFYGHSAFFGDGSKVYR
jgi:hypothetical protein